MVNMWPSGPSLDIHPANRGGRRVSRIIKKVLWAQPARDLLTCAQMSLARCVIGPLATKHLRASFSHTKHVSLSTREKTHVLSSHGSQLLVQDLWWISVLTIGLSVATLGPGTPEPNETSYLSLHVPRLGVTH